MQSKNSAGPPDLIHTLVDNYKHNRPLLEGAVLFRGTQLPDQTQGSFSKDEMHGALLPQIAASYTHNWGESDKAYIGTYPIDREKTRFYTDYGLEQVQNGKPVQSYSVADVERKLEMLVSDIAEGLNSKTRYAATEKLEAYIRNSFYEASIATKTMEGKPHRPQELFIYHGRPDMADRQFVQAQMEKVGPQQELAVKGVMLSRHRNEAGQLIHESSVSTPKFAEGLQVIQRVAQRDYAADMVRKHGAKPLNEFMDGIAAEPLSTAQAQLGRLAKALSDGTKSDNPMVKVKAEAILSALPNLDKEHVSVPDMLKTIQHVSNSVGKSSGTSVEKPGNSTASPTRTTSPALDR